MWALQFGHEVEVGDFVEACAFVAADAFEFRRAPAVIIFADLFDLRLVAQEPWLGRVEHAASERFETRGERGEFFLPPGRL
jgi:hypothetical protein